MAALTVWKFPTPYGAQAAMEKLQALQAHGPELVATANIGCMKHLQSGTKLAVRHWIELIDMRSTPGHPAGHGRPA